MHFDEHGPWELEVAGFEVLHMTFGADRVDIAAYGPEGITSEIRLEGPFELHQPTGSTERIDPQTDSWYRFVPLFELRHDTIRFARITNTSQLHVQFVSGRALTSSGADLFENWQMSAPGGVCVIAQAGRPTIFDGDPANTIRATVRDGNLVVVDPADGPGPPTPAR